MSDTTKDTDQGKKPEPDSGNDIRAELEALSRKVLRYEEDLAYKDREIERLKEAKDNRDKQLDKSQDPEFFKAKEKEIRDEFAQREERLKADLDKTARELKSERVVKTAMLKAATYFNDDQLELIQGVVERVCDLQDGQPIVKNDKGEIRYSEANPRIPMTLDELMQELVKKYPSSARPTGRQGSDTNEGQNFKSKGSGSTGKDYEPQDLAGVGIARANEIIKSGSVESARKFLREVTKLAVQ